MKPNELMIGDWVVYNGDIEYTDPIRIEGIDIMGVCITSDRDDVGFDGIQPIPLTEEILKKNGFGYKEEDDYLSHYYLGDKCYLSNPDLHIGTSNKGVYWLNYWYNAIYGIKYVHQLQHALQLCGIGNEIEL